MKLIRNNQMTEKSSNNRTNGKSQKKHLTNKGITLIALIITIIILLILAGVTIQFTLGENGILRHAQNSGEKYSMQSVKEELELDVADIKTEIYKEERRKATLIDLNNLLNKEKYNTELHYEPLATTETPSTIPTYLLVTRKNTKYTFIINDKFEVKVMSSTDGNGGDSNGGNSEENAGDETLIITSITLANETLEISRGNEETINVTLKPADASKKKLKWESSDDSIATVDENGKIKALKQGTVTITVSSKDDVNVSCQCSITVKTNLISVTADEIIANPKKYYGSQVMNYKVNEDDTNIYRIFYVDEGNYFKDGSKTIYLKADEQEKISCSTSFSTSSTIVGRMNPVWYSKRKNYSSNWREGEKVSAWLCDQNKWNSFKNGEMAVYAIGSPSVEMYQLSYNLTHDANEEGIVPITLTYETDKTYGYGVKWFNNYASASAKHCTPSHVINSDEFGGIYGSLTHKRLLGVEFTFLQLFRRRNL